MGHFPLWLQIIIFLMIVTIVLYTVGAFLY